MAELTINSADVQPATNYNTQSMAGDDVMAGDVVYITSQEAYLASNNNEEYAPGSNAAAGIAVCLAASGQPLYYQSTGPITLGTVLTKGRAYYLGSTPGTICLFEDLTTGDHITLLGVAKSTSALELTIKVTGVQV